MIGVDTSSLIAFLSGEDTPDTYAVKQSLHSQQLALPPVVLMEALSDPRGMSDIRHFLLELPMLDAHESFWLNAAKTRETLLKLKLKAKLGDALIAQSCIDHNVPLITRDNDFRHYAKYCGLMLYA